ncbi:hypothetical protein N431DRAFT_445061 [Stipitochalara longipes BDJ]|nr:hypothetical protein N431DRAFT_445061 [Stipitochalara longipes BDJ]
MTAAAGVVRRLARNAANLFRQHLEILRPRDSPLTIKYDVEWEVPKFLATCFTEGQELGKVLTATGEALNAQAQSCADYLAQTWPEIGPVLLDGLHEVFAVGKQLKSNAVSESFTSNASLVVLASHTFQRQIASALSWISAAVRHSSYNTVAYSSTSIAAKNSTNAGHNISILLEELSPLRNEGLCWYPLLPHAVIVKGFPIRERICGKGLEISFADMALLSQSLSFTEHGQGLIVEGLRSVLIPMETIPHDDAIQWHLEYKRHSKLPKKRSVSDILASHRFSNWYKRQSPSELTERRCFLGWAEKIAVVIGTAEYSNIEIYCSGALHTPKTGHVKVNSISMEASGFGLFGAKGSKSWHTTSVPSKITLELDKDIYDTFADEYLTRLMVYDTEERISWLLPQPSVVLYMIHKIIARRRYRLFDGDKETDFLFANPVADGGGEADSTLRKLLRLKVQKTPDFKECLSRTVRQVLLWLDQIRDGSKSASTELEVGASAAGSCLYGVEFNAVLEMKSSIDIKQAHVDQPWIQLVRDGSVALFCAGLSQPIISMSPNLCATYTRVPPLRDLMATTANVLESILHHHDRGSEGSQLGDTIEWIRDDNLIQSHIQGDTLTVFHEQRLRVVKKARLDPSIHDGVRRNISSSFIFTNHRSQTACSEVIASMESTTSRLAKDNFVYDNKTLPDVPEDDSSSIISSENDYGFNNEQLPTSSISSNESSVLEMECKLFRPIMARTSDTSTDYRESVCVVETSSGKQMHTARDSASGPLRTIKRKSRCMDLASSADKGKGRASEEEGSSWTAPTGYLTYIPRNAIEPSPVDSGIGQYPLVEGIENIDSRDRKAE